MKRLFNSLLFAIVMFSLLWAGIANADTGMFYNPERDGEGIVATKDENGRLAFAFFTYIETNAANEIPPTVSPPAPVVPVVTPECIIEPQIPPGVEIPPVVSPRPPPSENPENPENPTLYGGIQAWFVGTDLIVDGITIGDLYYHVPISYPYSFDGFLSDAHIVATFFIQKTETGYEMQLDCNGKLPSSLYICNHVLTFNQLIIGKP